MGDTNMKTFLPKVKGTEDVFDYIKFLEYVLTDLKDILSALSKKFIEDFNLTMGLSNTKRVKQKKPTQPSKYDDLPCLECIELRKEADQSSDHRIDCQEETLWMARLLEQIFENQLSTS